MYWIAQMISDLDGAAAAAVALVARSPFYIDNDHHPSRPVSLCQVLALVIFSMQPAYYAQYLRYMPKRMRDMQYLDIGDTGHGV